MPRPKSEYRKQLEVLQPGDTVLFPKEKYDSISHICQHVFGKGNYALKTEGAMFRVTRKEAPECAEQPA